MNWWVVALALLPIQWTVNAWQLRVWPEPAPTLAYRLSVLAQFTCVVLFLVVFGLAASSGPVSEAILNAGAAGGR